MFTMQAAVNEKWTNQPKFWEGHIDGIMLRKFKEYDGVDGQAYDRGYEVGMHESHPPEAKKIKYEHWGDDPDIGQTVGLN
jgi:hypothetical protein